MNEWFVANLRIKEKSDFLPFTQEIYPTAQSLKHDRPLPHIFKKNYELEHRNMKTEIMKIFTFSCMFIVLGAQALLEGSWRVQDSKKCNSKDRSLS